MSKIAEKMFEEDGKIIVQQKHDFSPVLERAVPCVRFPSGLVSAHSLPRLRRRWE